jgi:hypothetical protein
MKQKLRVFFDLLYAAISDTAFNVKAKKQFKTEYLEDFYTLSQKHDVSHLLAHVLFNEGMIPRDSSFFEKLKKSQLLAGYRFERNLKEKETLSRVLKEAEIPFVLLKGAVISELYPKPWMRTSSDIDVLVKEKDFDKARTVLSEKCGYTQKNVYTHDVSMYSEEGVHIELHYKLMEQDTVNRTEEILDNVWEYVDENGKMNDEFFYFYFIAHTAKHFRHGGCGIKPLLDLWILINKLPQNEKRDTLLEQGSLIKFEKNLVKLTAVWFSDAASDELTDKITRYILLGGVYGKKEQYVLVGRAKEGGRLKYFLSRMLLPYDTIRYQYPVLNKHKYLTPFFQVVRWFRILFGGKIKSSADELRMSDKLSTAKIEETAQMLEELGI